MGDALAQQDVGLSPFLTSHSRSRPVGIRRVRRPHRPSALRLHRASLEPLEVRLLLNGSGYTPQTVPYFQDFAALPTAAQGWEYYSTAEGRIEAAAGELRMDDRVNNATNSLNEAIVHLDLRDVARVQLRLDHRQTLDERQIFSGTQFTGHTNADLIAVSVNGVHWVKLTDLGAAFTAGAFDLEPALRQAAVAAGTPDRSDVRIKLQQYDNQPRPNDGRSFANLQVTGQAVLPIQKPVAQAAPYFQDFSAAARRRPRVGSTIRRPRGGSRPPAANCGWTILWPAAPTSLNEAVLHVNLASVVGPQLRLDHRLTSDERHVFNGTQFLEQVNADLVAVSLNGFHWVKVTDSTTAFAARGFALEPLLVQAGTAAGTSNRSDVRIKLQQYDNDPRPSDGRSFDNVAVIGLRGRCRIAQSTARTPRSSSRRPRATRSRSPTRPTRPWACGSACRPRSARWPSPAETGLVLLAGSGGATRRCRSPAPWPT